jgi:hypothetical protein
MSFSRTPFLTKKSRMECCGNFEGKVSISNLPYYGFLKMLNIEFHCFVILRKLPKKAFYMSDVIVPLHLYVIQELKGNNSAGWI